MTPLIAGRVPTQLFTVTVVVISGQHRVSLVHLTRRTTRAPGNRRGRPSTSPRTRTPLGQSCADAQTDTIRGDTLTAQSDIPTIATSRAQPNIRQCQRVTAVQRTCNPVGRKRWGEYQGDDRVGRDCRTTSKGGSEAEKRQGKSEGRLRKIGGGGRGTRQRRFCLSVQGFVQVCQIFPSLHGATVADTTMSCVHLASDYDSTRPPSR